MPKPKQTSAPKKSATSVPKTAAAPPKQVATRIPPVKVIPTGPIAHSKTLANGQPRPKSRRSK